MLQKVQQFSTSAAWGYPNLKTVKVWVTPCYKRFSNSQHLQGCFVKANKHSIVDLLQTEKLKDFTSLWSNLVDTSNTDHKGKFWLIRNKVITICLSYSVQPDLIFFLLPVFLNILLCSFENQLLFGLVCLLL